MKIIEFNQKEEMLRCYGLLHEMYPSLTLEQYSRELDIMLPHNYSQVVVIDNGEIVGLTGVWVGSKLWCGKYMELDNVVVSEKARSKGFGDLLFKYVEDKAQKAECTMLALDSYTHNFKAHKFFYNQGYSPKGFHFIKILKKDGVR